MRRAHGFLVVKPHPFLFLAVAVLLAVQASQRRRLVLGALATAGPLLSLVFVLRPSWYAQWLAAAFGLQSEPGSKVRAGNATGLEEAQSGSISDSHSE